MELPATTSSMNLISNFQCFREQQQSIVKRAPWCNADNCYRALFPCPSPSAVTEAVRFCGTVSANSATNYPTRAIDACGTSKDRYISACSCPATNCPVGESVDKTTTSQQTTQHTVPLVVTTTIPEKVSSVYDPVGKVTVDQVPATEPDAGAAPTATVNNVADGLDEESGVRSTDKSTTTESLDTGDASLHHVSTTHGQSTSQGISSTESHLPTPSSHSILPNSTEKSQDTISESSSSLLLPVLSKVGSITKSEAPSRTSQPTRTTLYVPTTDSAPKNTPEKLSAGLIVAITVGGTLVFLLLIGAAVYCCLKRRTARRPRSSSLIGKEDSSKEVKCINRVETSRGATASNDEGIAARAARLPYRRTLISASWPSPAHHPPRRPSLHGRPLKRWIWLSYKATPQLMLDGLTASQSAGRLAWELPSEITWGPLKRVYADGFL
ncbi:hypothetical protein NPX13_g7142 [Xylaria arbuscula]|uniref:Uncharacterized protein n=1 Tax=Xylaria arbuscula TaxID=114810 RepID=A0A9W8TJR2_9PEZI|nr:hypothetical protein NPX13_g7142 [Xylaria arbuscula]